MHLLQRVMVNTDQINVKEVKTCCERVTEQRAADILWEQPQLTATKRVGTSDTTVRT